MFLSRCRVLLVVAVALSMLSAGTTYAQGFYAGAQMMAGYQPWGSGTFGGAQGCIYNEGYGGKRQPKEIRDMEDDIKRDEKELARLRKERSALDKDVKDLKRKTDKGIGAFKTIFKDRLVDGILQHVGYGKGVHPLNGSNTALTEACNGGSLKEGTDIAVPGSWGSMYCAANGGAVSEGADGSPESQRPAGADGNDWQGRWERMVKPLAQSTPGAMDPDVCSDSGFVKGDYISQSRQSSTRENAVAACREAARYISGELDELERKEQELVDLDKAIRDMQDDIKQAKKSKNKRADEIEDDERDGNYDGDYVTEGDVCPSGNCRGSYRVSTTDRIINLVGSLGIAAGSYFGLKSYGKSMRRAAQYASDKNAELGWPTTVPQGWGLSPYSAFGLALPMAMNGIYGATFGGGIGGNGCGGFGGIGGMAGWPGAGMYNGGAFGYPSGWGPNGGGGIMNGGCGPWGCTGYPGGYPGGGYGVPYANMGGAYPGGFQGYPGPFAGGVAGAYPGGFPGGYQGGGFPGGYGGVGFPGGYAGGPYGPFAPTFNAYPYPAGGGVGFPGGYPGGYSGGGFPGGYAPYAGPYPMAGGPITGVYSTNTGIPYVPFGGTYAGQYTGGAMAPTYNAYPYPGGAYMPMQGYPAGGGYAGYPGVGYAGYPGVGFAGYPGAGYSGVYSGYHVGLMQVGASVSNLNLQIQSILYGAGSASGFGGGYGGYGGYGYGYPTGTILPYPNSTYTPTNTTTTGTGVQPGRGRFQ